MSKSLSKYILIGGVAIGLLSLVISPPAKGNKLNHRDYFVDDNTIAIDTPTVPLHYNFTDQSTGDPLNYPNGGGLRLGNPSNITTTTEYDPTTGYYNLNQKMGDMDYRPPTYM